MLKLPFSKHRYKHLHRATSADDVTAFLVVITEASQRPIHPACSFTHFLAFFLSSSYLPIFPSFHIHLFGRLPTSILSFPSSWFLAITFLFSSLNLSHWPVDQRARDTNGPIDGPSDRNDPFGPMISLGSNVLRIRHINISGLGARAGISFSTFSSLFHPFSFLPHSHSHSHVPSHPSHPIPVSYNFQLNILAVTLQR